MTLASPIDGDWRGQRAGDGYTPRRLLRRGRTPFNHVVDGDDPDTGLPEVDEDSKDQRREVAGNLIRSDQGSKARFIGIQAEVVLEYEHSRNVGFLVSYSQFHPGRYIEDTGPSKTVHFVHTEKEFRF